MYLRWSSGSRKALSRRRAQADGGPVALLDAPPKVRQTAEAEGDFYRRKQKQIAIRHVSGHRLATRPSLVPSLPPVQTIALLSR